MLTTEQIKEVAAFVTDYYASDYRFRIPRYEMQQQVKNRWGISWLGDGIAKEVFDLGNGNVLKICKGKDGYQMDREITLWLCATPEQAKWLAPIVDADLYKFLWEVQVKADTLGLPPHEIRTAMEAATGKNDIAGGNCGMINGQWVMVDYAV